jgi:hypothetical protein
MARGWCAAERKAFCVALELRFRAIDVDAGKVDSQTVARRAAGTAMNGSPESISRFAHSFVSDVVSNIEM